MQINVVIVGAEYSGKTSILKSIVGEEPKKEYYLYDINVRKLKHTIEQKEYEFILRDIPSKEKFIQRQKFYLKDAQIILLICDVTDEIMFDDLEN